MLTPSFFFATDILIVSLPFFSETAMFKYLHTSLAEGFALMGTP